MRSLRMNGKDKTVGIHLLSLHKGTGNRETQTEDLLCVRDTRSIQHSASPQPPKWHNSPEAPGELSPWEVVPTHHPDVGTRQHQEARFLMKNCSERLWHTGQYTRPWESSPDKLL